MSNLWVTEQAAAFARLQKQNGVWSLAFDICSSALLVNAWNSPSGEIVNSNFSLELTFHQVVKLGKKVKNCRNTYR